MNESPRSHFAAKHPAGTTVPSEVKAGLEARIEKGCITCAAAHAVARALSIHPEGVGQAIDLLEGRIEKCQLGLFGYGARKKIVDAGQAVDPKIRETILAASLNGCLTCGDAWTIAERLAVPRLAIGTACESLGIKVVRCQLGAF